MIHLQYALRRLPELSREEFQRTWRDDHAPLVRAHANAIGLRRYVQVHTRETPLDAGLRSARGADLEPYDGVAHLWFDDLPTLATHLGRPEAQEAARALLEDERRFIDLPRSPIWLAEDFVVLDGES